MKRPILLLWGLVAPAVQAGPTQVDLFTDAAHPLQNRQAFERQSGVVPTLHDLSATARLTAQLSQGLPSDPEAAAARIRERSADPDVQAALHAAAVEQTAALVAGIDRIPAIVFDGQQVIYGVTDLAEAWRCYEQWLQSGGVR